jgi:hypothetical protein
VVFCNPIFHLDASVAFVLAAATSAAFKLLDHLHSQKNSPFFQLKFIPKKYLKLPALHLFFSFYFIR